MEHYEKEFYKLTVHIKVTLEGYIIHIIELVPK